MKEWLFPKPSPATPLPEDVWLRHTDRSEAGREPFFCGRDADYEVFRSALLSLDDGVVGGGTMIFQGAPGAGKSALMLECMEAVRCHSTPEDPWVAVSIYPETLSSSIAVVRRMIQSVNKENERLAKIASGPVCAGLRHLLKQGETLLHSLAERGVAVGGISVSTKPSADSDSQPTMPAEIAFLDVSALLEKVRIVVFVDKAQNTPTTDSAKGVIACLHHPPGKISLVATFFDLSDTRRVLRDCGLSRFAHGRVRDLETLSMEEATTSFRRMLDAYYGGTNEEKMLWAKALAKLSQGWPQHINCVGTAAGLVLRSNGGRVQQPFLEQALEHGIDGKNEYYEGRVEAGSNRPWVYRHLAEAASKKEGAMSNILSYDEIDMLTEPARRKNHESMSEFLANALHAGLLASVPRIPDHYKIPIPSLADYLRSLPDRPAHSD